MFSFGELQFPSWWDVNTHKANSTCTFPVKRKAYGFGRAAVGDWGRVGACEVLADEHNITTHDQILCNLVNRIHLAGSPVPVLPPYYCIPRQYFDTKHSDETPVVSTARENVLKHLINDPVFGSQACAAYCCLRIFSLIRNNMHPRFKGESRDYLSKRSSCAKTREFLGLINKCSTEVLEAGCAVEIMNSVLDRITNFTACIENFEEVEKPIRNAKTRKRKPSSELQRRITPLQPKLASIFDIPFDQNKCDLLKNRLTNGTATVYLSPPERRGLAVNRQPVYQLAAAIDPFLITLAGRRVNSAFLGNGCLRVAQSPYTFQPASPVLLWAPPNSRTDKTQPLCIYFAMAPSLSSKHLPLSASDFTKIEFPVDSIGSTLCELDALQIADSRVYLVARTTSRLVYTMAVTLDNEESNQLMITSSKFIPSIKLDFKPASIAVSSWRPTFGSSSLKSTDWVVAGRQFSSPQTYHEAIVHLYDAKTNEALWTGNILLDQQGECITTEFIDVSIAASLDGKPPTDKLGVYANNSIYEDLLSYCGQRRQKSTSPFLTPEQVLRSAELKFELSHSSTWLRAGFADAPGLLMLTTPKRLLHLDIRVPSKTSVVQELFNLSSTKSNLGNGQLFNPMENIFNTPSHFLKGSYVFLGTDYNGLLLDKRMPGRPVLHWSHGLRGPLSYLDWCLTNSGSPTAQAMLVAASQFPVETSVTGINFSTSLVSTRPTPPQLVGPSLSGGDLGSVFKSSSENGSCGFLPSDSFKDRINVCLIGAATLPIMSSDRTKTIGIQGLSLTSFGDIFSHEWYFDKDRAIQRGQAGLISASDWRTSFADHESHRVPLLGHSEFARTVLHEPCALDALSFESIKENVKEDESINESQPTPTFLSDKYQSVLRKIAKMTYAKELYNDMEKLWDDGTFMSNCLSPGRSIEEKSRQGYLDNIIAKISRGH